MNTQYIPIRESKEAVQVAVVLTAFIAGVGGFAIGYCIGLSVMLP